MNIQKPPAPLNAKDRPTVIVKKGNEYEAGTLMYIGIFSGKEIAGLQMSVRQPSKFEMPLNHGIIIIVDLRLCLDSFRT